jgi:O-antigen ligase
MTASTPFDVHVTPAHRIARILDYVLMVGSCATLGFGPVAIGAVQPWSICVLEVTVSLLFLIWAARAVLGGTIRIVSNPLYIPTALFALLVTAQLAFHLSAYWHATWTRGLLCISYAGLLFLVSQVFRQQRSVSAFGYFCIGYGFLISLFAIVQQFTSNGKIYWVISNRNGGWIYGPYVNHAHYAGLMEMLVPFPLILAFVKREERSARAFFLFAAVVMASTIFLSESLGGMISFAAEVVAFALIMLRKKSFTNREIALLSVLCLCLAVWLAWLRPPGLVERLARLLNPIADAGATGRIAIVKDSLRMLRLRPFFGWGLGTFPEVYPSFRSFYTNLWVNEAHNDFVQTLVECGTTGFAIAAAFVILLYRGAACNLRRWRGDTRSGVILAASLGCLGLLIHGLVDFNLQIPANAAFFFALSGIVTACSDTPPVNREFADREGSRNGSRKNAR